MNIYFEFFHNARGTVQFVSSLFTPQRSSMRLRCVVGIESAVATSSTRGRLLPRKDGGGSGLQGGCETFNYGHPTHARLVSP